jgi:hypothetical protein
LVGQKSAVTSKLLAKAKEQLKGSKDQGASDLKEEEDVKEEGKLAGAVDSLMQNSGILKIFKTREEKLMLEALRLPNPQKRHKALSEIKKVV